ncbi:hypothetical protein [Pseudonocardia sp. H11422]|uniref:hypothetical protein n=1 Tax=Pseudonocardia sp. H11422 TaxID=2835866 RepID=UPI001BDCAF15|nr:hypothetical protein [Pseudonocardia sp. H11422]
MNAAKTLARTRERADSTMGSIGDVVDTVADAAPEFTRQARELLAERIDPDRGPRRRRRWLLAGLVVTAVSAVVWAVLSRRPQQVEPQLSSDWPVPATPPGGSRINGDPAASAVGGPAARNGSSGR